MSGAKGITLFVDIKGNGSGRDDGEEKDRCTEFAGD